MKLRYYKQRDKFSCGAVALYNALKWCGVVRSWGEWGNKIKGALDTKSGRGGGRVGTRVVSYLKGARSLHLPVRVVKWDGGGADLKRVVKSGCGAIVFFKWESEGQSGFHYFFIERYEEGLDVYKTVGMYTVNSPLEKWVEREKMEEALWRMDFAPQFWLIKREG